MSARAFVMGLVAGVVVIGAPVGRYAYIVTQQKDSLESQVVALQARNSQMENAGQRLVAEARQLAKPDLPIEVSTRTALFSGGRVLVIRNASPRELDITAQLERGDSPPVTKALVIPPNGFVQVGPQQGWAFARGDSVTLSDAGYRPWHNAAINW